MDNLKSLELEVVQSSLLKILEFLLPYLPLANAHASNFITEDYWNRLMPGFIQEELLNLTEHELKSLPLLAEHLEDISHDLESKCELGEVNDKLAGENQALENQTDEIRRYATQKGDIQTILSADTVKKTLTPDTPDYGREQTKVYRSESDFPATSVGGPDVIKEKIKDESEESNTCKVWNHAGIKRFCREAWQCSLEESDLVVSMDDLRAKFGQDKQSEVFIGTFMNKKKSHEVEAMSQTCAMLATSTQCHLIIDFGSGKGYLGNHLCLQHSLPVLGIDAVITNTDSAERRKHILNKQWAGLTRNTQQAQSDQKLTKKEKKAIKEKEKQLKNGTFIPVSSSDRDETGETGKLELLLAKEKLFKEQVILGSVPSSHCEKGETPKKCSPRYVPVTMFIDKETDFIELAMSAFPELFDNHGSEDEMMNENKVNMVDDNHDSIHKSMSDKRDSIDKTVSDKHDNIDKSVSDENVDKTVSDKHDNIDKTVSDEHDNIDKTVSDKHDNIDKTVSDKHDNIDKSVSDKHDNIDKTVSDKHDNIDKTVSDKHDKHDNIDKTADEKHNSKVKITKEKTKLNLLLTGLHTCGNLASTSLKLFVHSPDLQSLCSVGCCYHLLDEEYLSKDCHDVAHCGFPMSAFLGHRHVSVGLSARNLASQSVHRMTIYEELQGERFFPRALLEVIIRDVCGQEGAAYKGLRKLEQKCSSVQEYIRRASDKLQISDKITDEMIDAYIARYGDQKHRLAAFFQLRTVLAPCIEAVIILDRLCFLLEQVSVKEVYLVKMFDPVISPRCYGIIATKS